MFLQTKVEEYLVLICELASMLQDGLTNILDRKRETIYSVMFVLWQPGYVHC